MTQHRRAFALVIAAGLLIAATHSPAWAWSWNGSWGTGKRVQAAGETASETREVSPFDSVNVSGHFKVRVRQEGREAVTVQADRNLLPLIETRVSVTGSQRVLEIGLAKGYSTQGLPTPELWVDVKTLRALTLSGSGDVRIAALKSDQLDLALAGSGDVALAGLQVARLGIRVSGSGDVVASGQSEALTVSVAGSGDVKAAELKADDVRVNVAGSGDVTVHAARHLKVGIAGSGDVRYAGAPQVESSVAGSGSVKRLGER